MSALEDDEIVYLARSVTKRVMSVGLSVASRLPAYCISMGRVLLAALPTDPLAQYLQRVELKPLTPKTIKSKKRLLAELKQVR